MSDPYPGQGLGGDQTPTGTQPPQTAAADAKRIADLEAENAKLREERRADRAKVLGSQHGLTPTQVELLSTVNADEMEAKAAKLGEEFKALVAAGATPAAAAAAVGATPPAEPPNAAALAAMQMGSGGQGAPPVVDTPPANTTDAMMREIGQATSMEEVEAIQQKYQRMRSEEMGP